MELRLWPAGLFTALTTMIICWARMEGSQLTALVCTQCPRLKDLILSLELVAISDLSLCSLLLFVRNTRRLEVVAPRLEALAVLHAMQAHISAPKLAALAWQGDTYDPLHHRFAGVGRRLQELIISKNSLVASLIRQFDVVDKLNLEIFIPVGIAGYESFLNETNRLPKCTTLTISLELTDHGLAPAMSHLLRSCNNKRKLYVQLDNPWYSASMHSCPLSCPCRLEESCKIDGTALSSLEEVEICGFTDSREKIEFVEFLSCNAAILKKLVINYTTFRDPPVTKEVCEKKIRSMRHPNIKVEFFVPMGEGSKF